MRKIMIGIIGLTLIFISVSYFPQAKAATVTVTNLNDSGAGSLRQAIADAIPDDTIDFTVTGTIVLTGGELVIGKNLTISGPGATRLAISGNNASRVFNIGSSATVIMSGLTVSNGHYGNWGGGINNDGTLTMIDCMIGPGNNANVGGGGLNNGGTATLMYCTISGNSGTGVVGGGSINNEASGILTLINCTVSGNVTFTEGGGIRNLGNLTLINSTITNNIGNADGDGAGDTGGIKNHGAVQVRNTIIAGNIDNSPTNKFHDVSGTFTSLGYNLIGISDGSTGFANGVNGDIVGTIASPVDPRLGPLSYNGGPTKTHALLLGSPAKDAIPEGGNGYNGAPQTDQRGVRRPQPPGGDCDIGAFEVSLSQGIQIERNPQPSLLPLASNNISRGNDLLNRANDLVSQAKSKGLDAALCEKAIDEAHEILDKAKASRANPIYANNLALKAIEKLKQSIDCLKALLR